MPLAPKAQIGAGPSGRTRVSFFVSLRCCAGCEMGDGERDRNRRTTRTGLAGEALSKPRLCWACLVIAAYGLRPKGGVAALFFARQCPLAFSRFKSRPAGYCLPNT